MRAEEVGAEDETADHQAEEGHRERPLRRPDRRQRVRDEPEPQRD